MSRYIDADRLKEVFHRNVVSAEAFNVLIDNAPTVDVVERKHGKWLLDGRCSECLVAPLTSHKNYCPNCGSDMRERREDVRLDNES